MEQLEIENQKGLILRTWGSQAKQTALEYILNHLTQHGLLRQLSDQLHVGEKSSSTVVARISLTLYQSLQCAAMLLVFVYTIRFWANQMSNPMMSTAAATLTLVRTAGTVVSSRRRGRSGFSVTD